jgi:hypothetical protein
MTDLAVILVVPHFAETSGSEVIKDLVLTVLPDLPFLLDPKRQQQIVVGRAGSVAMESSNVNERESGNA